MSYPKGVTGSAALTLVLLMVMLGMGMFAGEVAPLVEDNTVSASGRSFGLIADSMMLEDRSKYDFEETVARFEEEVEAAGWGILNYHDMQEVKAGHGFEVDEVKVFDLCSAEYSAEILELDDERIVSPFMPCRVSIYNKSDGNTYIARMNSPLVAGFFGGTIDEVMQTAAEETEAIIDEVTVEDTQRGNSAVNLRAGAAYSTLADDDIEAGSAYSLYMGPRVNLTPTVGMTAEYNRYFGDDLSLNGLSAGLFYEWPEAAEDLDVILGGDIGYYFGEVDDVDLESGFGFRINTELSYQIEREIALNVSPGYRYLNLDNEEGESLDLSGFEMRAGLEYTF